MSKLQYLDNEIVQRAWNVYSPLVSDIIDNCIEACDILTKSELHAVMNDFEWIHGDDIYR